MMEETDIDEVATQIRARVIEVLELASDKDAQLDYQTRAPHVQVSNEIFNQWEDYYRPDTEEFGMAFSTGEIQALATFNQVFELVCEETPQVMPPIADFVETDSWRRYSSAARAALAVLGSTSTG